MLLKTLEKIIIRLLILLIKIYQKIFSFDHGYLKILKPNGACRFYPTCSQYTIEALNKKGLFKGIIASFNRLRRCHPFSDGGYDPA